MEGRWLDIAVDAETETGGRGELCWMGGWTNECVFHPVGRCVKSEVVPISICDPIDREAKYSTSFGHG